MNDKEQARALLLLRKLIDHGKAIDAAMDAFVAVAGRDGSALGPEAIAVVTEVGRLSSTASDASFFLRLSGRLRTLSSV